MTAIQQPRSPLDCPRQDLIQLFLNYPLPNMWNTLALRDLAVERYWHQTAQNPFVHPALECRQLVAGENVLGLRAEIDHWQVHRPRHHGLSGDHSLEPIRGDGPRGPQLV